MSKDKRRPGLQELMAAYADLTATLLNQMEEASSGIIAKLRRNLEGGDDLLQLELIDHALGVENKEGVTP